MAENRSVTKCSADPACVWPVVDCGLCWLHLRRQQEVERSFYEDRPIEPFHQRGGRRRVKPLPSKSNRVARVRLPKRGGGYVN
ncbi:MAG: hypothetical protein L0387_31000 [Acidobacteria bacterium]|nr:hypothetical protein [Acidobacteriota bacterium]